VGALQAEGVEDADRVLGEISRRVRRRARLVADDEPGAGREAPAELVLPPEHLGGRSADEEDRRVGGSTEGLHADVHPVCPNDLLVGPCRPSLRVRSG